MLEKQNQWLKDELLELQQTWSDLSNALVKAYGTAMHLSEIRKQALGLMDIEKMSWIVNCTEL
ncbi:hypothetical protein B0I35DRAFT_446843 [Stachybotrys elegans]|uniref:Uncharacterized protein n=1 Tax=Stachybotrys elegans TaxID=80388 RepID=A0A8K0WJF2_9HYPO|nr:hypothetical protein B0I35DRAFT_446843 [Stachybotrys elegans]